MQWPHQFKDFRNGEECYTIQRDVIPTSKMLQSTSMSAVARTTSANIVLDEGA